MSLDTLVVILLVWTVAGLMAAIIFGKAIHENSASGDELLSASGDMVDYFRKDQSYPVTPNSSAVKSQSKSTRRKAK